MENIQVLEILDNGEEWIPENFLIINLLEFIKQIYMTVFVYIFLNKYL